MRNPPSTTSFVFALIEKPSILREYSHINLYRIKQGDTRGTEYRSVSRYLFLLDRLNEDGTPNTNKVMAFYTSDGVLVTNNSNTMGNQPLPWEVCRVHFSPTTHPYPFVEQVRVLYELANRRKTLIPVEKFFGDEFVRKAHVSLGSSFPVSAREFHISPLVS